ncbi:MAG: tRNA guanosine(34) transglycosylase Tgt [Anaerolineae bacterium]|jgi:queuine tRNA-ribosyltransferase|nr:tRNA guanosine(34) transglycosylase Tgt [Anaerolineae bacterium]
MKSLMIRNKAYSAPIYLPDATFGVVRGVSPEDLKACGIEAVVMNTYHLMQKPGSSTVSSLGGLHQMSGWDGLIVTDSGGFQAYSLIRQNPKMGSMTDKGISFRPEGAKRNFLLTPEKCIQLQFAYGSDVMITLDDCTHVDDSQEEQVKSVRRTINWAKRCKDEYERLLDQKKIEPDQRPLLFGVVQGGGDFELRAECAHELLAIGFDGFGYGGWPLDGEGNLLTEMMSFLRQQIPAEFPLHALGVGHPENVLAGYQLGYDIFDCAMPTRDARHGRLFTFVNPASDVLKGLSGKWLQYLYIQDDKHIKDTSPISKFCDCYTCQNFSRGYLRHLFKMNELLFFRLATIHNLRFMTQLTERIILLGGSND